MELLLHPYELPLRHTFTTSHGSRSTVDTLIVELRDGGFSGYGEAAANPYFGASIENMCQALEAARTEIGSVRWTDPAEFWQRMQPLLGDRPFALCALDQAAHDLWGKQTGRPVHELWGLTTDRNPPSDYTIGIDSIDAMVRKLKEFDRFPVYKIKLGTPDDIRIVSELRRHTDAPFRVDANCGWDADETIRNSHAMKSLGVEFIEQPLPADRWEGMRRVHRESVLPVIADESCITERDVDRCADYFHGINIKLTKCGGMTPARRMIHRARQLNMKVMIGCMTESTVGISAIAQLLPLLDYADMDGPLLLARDIAAGVRIERGRVVYPEENGNGVRLL